MVEKVQKNIILDYLVMSFKVSDTANLLEFFTSYLGLVLSDFQEIKSYYGCQCCYYFSGIKLHCGDGLFIFDCSGKGCRAVESLCRDWFLWWDFLSMWDYDLCTRTDGDSFAVKIARMDVACDVLGSDLTVMKLSKCIRAKKFVCKSSYHSIIEGNCESAIYFGSPKSDRRLRIYDKAMEQGIDGSWTRFEFQLRNDNATSFYLNCKNLNGDIPRTYCGVMHDYLRFTTKANITLKHSSRLETCRWWSKFLGGMQKISQLYLPGNDYDLSSLSKFVNRQCASSIKTLLHINGGDVGELLDMVDSAEFNRKQLDLLNTYDTETQPEYVPVGREGFFPDGFFDVTEHEEYEQVSMLFDHSNSDPRLSGL